MSIRSRHQFGASCRLGSTERKVQPVGGPKVEDQRLMLACGTSGGHVALIRSWCLELLSSWFPQIAFSVLRLLLQLWSLHADPLAHLGSVRQWARCNGCNDNMVDGH